MISLIEVRKFLRESDKNYIKKSVYFILSSIIILMYIVFQSNIAEKNNQIELMNKNNDELRKMSSNQKKVISNKDKELSFYYFKDFYHSCSDIEIEKILGLIWKYSNVNKVNPYIMLSIASVESNFNQFARSHMGAYGLMQIHYVSWKQKYNIKNPDKLFDIEFNIRLGCEIFKKYLDLCNQDVPRALLMYNSGKKFMNKEYIQLISRNKYYNGFYNDKNEIKKKNEI